MRNSNNSSNKIVTYQQLTLPGFGKYYPTKAVQQLEQGEVLSSYNAMMEMNDDDTRALIVFLIDKLDANSKQ